MRRRWKIDLGAPLSFLAAVWLANLAGQAIDADNLGRAGGLIVVVLVLIVYPAKLEWEWSR